MARWKTVRGRDLEVGTRIRAGNVVYTIVDIFTEGGFRVKGYTWYDPYRVVVLKREGLRGVLQIRIDEDAKQYTVLVTGEDV